MISKIFNVLKFSFSEEILKYIEEAYNRAIGTGTYLGIFILAIMLIIFECKKEEKSRVKIVFGIYSIIILLLNFNPIFANISIKVIGSEVYWRVYWLLPIGFVLAYVFTEFIFRMSEKWKKILASIVVLFVIIIGGKWIYNEENFHSVNNYYKVPDSVLNVVQYISADNEDYKKLTGPTEFIIYTRQIDGTIILSDGRSFSGDYGDDSIVTYIYNNDYQNIYRKAEEINCNYVVLDNNTKRQDDDLTNYGFTKFYENIDYTVYKLEENTSWNITQYGKDENAQLMCYTIEGNKNGLVIVDGGYSDDEETLQFLEEKIRENGNVVNTWILTHFDDDHAGAYMTIKDRISDLKIGKLYLPDIQDIEKLKESVSWYSDEEWALYEYYSNLEAREKQYLYSEDEVQDIIGLKMKVLSSYDNPVIDGISNIPNNGSIIFKLEGNEESILFCGDVQSHEVSEYLVEKYGDGLKSEYLQVGHHGNNGFSNEFYETVNPKVAFFPATTIIMENTYNISWYSADKISDLLENMGAIIYSFKDSPSQIVMK